MSHSMLVVVLGAGAIAVPVVAYVVSRLNDTLAARYWSMAWTSMVFTGIAIAVGGADEAGRGAREIFGAGFAVLTLCGTLAYLQRPAARWLVGIPLLAGAHLIVLAAFGPFAARVFGGTTHALIVAGSACLLLWGARHLVSNTAVRLLAVALLGIACAQVLQPLDVNPAVAEVRLILTTVASLTAGMFQLLALVEWSRQREHWLQKQSDALHLLREAAADRLDPRGALVSAAAEVARLRPFLVFGIWLKTDHGFELLEQGGDDSPIPEHLRRAPPSRAILQAAEDASEPIFIEDLATDPRVTPESRGMGVRGAVIAPLRQHGSLLGVLAAALHTETPRDAMLERFVRELGETLSLGLANLRLREKLDHAHDLETMGTLAGGVAHDFNNHLTAILGEAAMLLADMPEDHPHAERIRDLHDSASRCADLSHDLLTLARPSSRKRGAVSLETAFADAARLVRPSLPIGVHLAVADASALPLVHAEAHDLHRVLTNLLLNARDAVGSHGRIALSAATVTDPGSGEESVEITVRDDGPGIDSEMRKRVFDPFFTTKSRAGGTGLGLSVCHDIVREHGGSISLASEPGEGATFRVRWPAAPVEVPPLSEARADESPPADPSPPRPGR